MSFGKELIANGRLGNDCEIGAFSYFSKQSCTTIDYLLLKADDFSMINQFSLGNFTTFSDHAPLCFDLKMTSIPRDKDRQNYFCTYIKWDSGQRDVFRRNIIGNLPSFNEIVQQACSDEIMVERFSNRICAAADPLFRRKSNKLEPKKTNSCHWFDLECKLAKNEYKSILKNFNKNKTPENRQILCTSKKKYKKIIRRKKIKYKREQAASFEDLKNKNPRQFWEFFKKKKKRVASDLSVNDFEKYFSSLVKEVKTVTLDDIESIVASDTFNINDETYEQLKVPITYTEVQAAIKRLNRNKAACPADNLLNEYFIESCDILCSHSTTLFNKVFNSGNFPECWAKGYIIPIHKKDNPNEAANYRGITLLSNLGKLFAIVLDARIEQWYNEYNILSDAQFGFRKKRSTVDALFVLKNLNQHVLFSKGRLYCAFIDLKKAFDSIYRNALWFKLFHMGFDGKILNIFKSMYSRVKSCVK